MSTISKKDARRWARALRSGKYKQTISTLQDGGGFCCLGVSCELFIPKSKQEREDGFLLGDVPEDGQKHAPKWLKKINDDLDKKLGNSFSEINDAAFYDNNTKLERFDFDEIADIIELVYVHKVIK